MTLTDPMRRLLAGQRRAVLATHDPDGSVHATPLAYVFDGHRFLMATPAGSRKVRNLMDRPAVTLLVEDAENTAWVSATGTAEVVAGASGEALKRRVYARWLTAEGIDVIGGWMGDDVTVAVTPRRWRGWDIEPAFFAPLRADGVPVDDTARWFR